MPDLDLIKQVEQEARKRRGRLPNCRSGNSVRWRRAVAARLLLAGKGEALTRKAFGLAPKR
jgi:hypothetical protein